MSLTPVESELLTPVDDPVEVDSIVPLLSETPAECDSDTPLLLDELLEEPLEVDEDWLPLTPLLTLAEATPGTPPPTDAPILQPSDWPLVVEELKPVEVELPVLEPLVSVAEVECPLEVPLLELEDVPDEVPSLWPELLLWASLPPVDELSL